MSTRQHPPRRSHRIAQIAALDAYAATRDEAPDCPYTYNRAINAAAVAAIRAGALDHNDRGSPSQISATQAVTYAHRAYTAAYEAETAADAADDADDDDYNPEEDYRDYAQDQAEQAARDQDRETRGYYPPRPDRSYPDEE